MHFLAPQFWDDRGVTDLGVVGKLLFACMITGPHLWNLPGLYRAFPGTFHKPMRPCGPDEVESAFKLILARGMAQFDDDAHVLRLPKCWKYHLPPNANQVIGWRRSWASLPDIQLRFDHLDTLKQLAERSESGKTAYQAYFSGIRQGDPSTYPFDRSWVDPNKKGNRSRNPSSNPSPSPASERKKQDLYISERSGTERETDTDLDPDTDLNQTQPSPNGSGNGSGMVPGRVSIGVAYGPTDDDQPTGADPQPGARREPGVAPGANGHSVNTGSGPPGDPGGVSEGNPQGRRADPVDNAELRARLRKRGIELD